jgi:hypothetical protein
VRDRETWRDIAILGAGVPLLFVNAIWAKPAFIVYSLTFGFFGILMNGEYPRFGSRRFWRAMPSIVFLHLVIVFGLVMVDLKVPGVQGLPRILFGFLTVIGLIEWRAALWILGAFRPKEQ